MIALLLAAALSAETGANVTDLMRAAPSASERNAVQLQLLQRLRSPSLRARLIGAAAAATAPIFIIQAKNHLSTAPSLALDAELTRLHRPHRLAIYPPIGKTAEEGHNVLYLAVDKWEPDVFPFLDEHVERRR